MMSGSIYACKTTKYCSGKSELVNQAAIVVYKSSTNQTGFSVDDSSRNLLRWMFADSWKCTSTGMAVSYKSQKELRSPTPGTFLANDLAVSIIFHSPTKELLQKFTVLKQAHQTAKVAELKKKHGRQVDSVLFPPIAHFLSSDSVAVCEGMGEIMRETNYVSIWPINGLGFGIYCEIFSQNIDFFLDQFSHQCIKEGVIFNLVKNETILPVW